VVSVHEHLCLWGPKDNGVTLKSIIERCTFSSFHTSAVPKLEEGMTILNNGRTSLIASTVPETGK
jgi:hypothetical protein